MDFTKEVSKWFRVKMNRRNRPLTAPKSRQTQAKKARGQWITVANNRSNQENHADSARRDPQLRDDDFEE